MGGESAEKQSRRSREDNARCSRGDELCGNSTPEKTGSRRREKVSKYSNMPEQCNGFGHQ